MKINEVRADILETFLFYRGNTKEIVCASILTLVEFLYLEKCHDLGIDVKENND